MPRTEATITTTTAVILKPALVKKLKTKLVAYAELKAEAKALGGRLTTHKDDLEALFSDAGEYEALEAGVRIDTPMGPVPMKIITGKTPARLNLVTLMKRHKLTPADLEACTDPGKDKEPYLGIYLPGDKD